MKRRIIGLVVVLTLTTFFTLFFYWHESFPKPIRAITALLGTPTAIGAGISHYLDLGIPVYETPWAVILSNLIASFIIYRLLFFLFKKKKAKNSRE